MLSATVKTGEISPLLQSGQLITRLPRTGFGNDRVLLSVKVGDLGNILRQWPIADPGIEHVFDY